MTEAAEKNLSSSQEDYLEAILVLVRKGRVARVRDIAKALGVGMPSVSTALKALARRRMVNYDPYQFITLTDSGERAAEEISSRHHVLRDFLTDVLGLGEDVAEANACRMEHAVDAEVLERFRQFAAYIQSSPQAAEGWLHELAAPHAPQDNEVAPQ